MQSTVLYLLSFDMTILHSCCKELTLTLIIAAYVIVKSCAARSCKAWDTRWS